MGYVASLDLLEECRRYGFVTAIRKHTGLEEGVDYWLLIGTMVPVGVEPRGRQSSTTFNGFQVAFGGKTVDISVQSHANYNMLFNMLQAYAYEKMDRKTGFDVPMKEDEVVEQIPAKDVRRIKNLVTTLCIVTAISVSACIVMAYILVKLMP